MNNQIKLNDGVSIHAPVWVRLFPSGEVETIKGFNSRTRVGATEDLTPDEIENIVSIHAPVWVRQIRDRRPSPFS